VHACSSASKWGLSPIARCLRSSYQCIYEGLMTDAAWYRGTPGSKFTKFGEHVLIGKTLNAAKFHRTRPNDVHGKLYKCLHPYFSTQRRTQGPKFAILSINVQQDPVYQYTSKSNRGLLAHDLHTGATVHLLGATVHP